MVVLSVCNTSKQLKDSKIDTAILPIGSVEQHGPHLPLGTDWFFAEEAAKKVAEKLDNCYLLPGIPYGNSQEHLDFSGTVTLKPSTLAQVVRDIVLSLYLNGIKKIIIIQGHGGNWIIKPTLRELNLEYPDLKIIHGGPMAEKPLDIHAGEKETSYVLHVDEELVKKEDMVDSVPDTTQEYLDYVGMEALSKPGNWGKPSQATREKGEEFVKTYVDKTCAYIKETLAKLDDLEKSSPRRSIIPKSPK